MPYLHCIVKRGNGKRLWEKYRDLRGQGNYRILATCTLVCTRCIICINLNDALQSIEAELYGEWMSPSGVSVAVPVCRQQQQPAPEAPPGRPAPPRSAAGQGPSQLSPANQPSVPSPSLLSPTNLIRPPPPSSRALNSFSHSTTLSSLTALLLHNKPSPLPLLSLIHLPKRGFFISKPKPSPPTYPSFPF